MLRGEILLLVLLISSLVIAQECTSTCTHSSFDLHPASERHIPGAVAAKILEKAIDTKSQNTVLPPVIIVPGLLGSGLQSKLDGADLPLLCSKNSDWERIWIQPNRMLQIQCFVDTLTLSYNPTTQEFSNTEGVDIAAIDFGGLNGVNYLAYNANGEPIASTEYMQPLITYLQTAGYTAQNLSSAPYDWRKTSDPNGWNSAFKALVEDLYTKNGGQPVFILAHSMGNLEVGSFFNSSLVDQDWKDTYIAGFMSVAAPWSGASLTLRATVSGLEFTAGLVTIPPSVVKNLVQTWGSLVWMAPDKYLLGDQPIVVTPTTSYTYQQIGQLLTDVGATQAAEVFSAVQGNLAEFSAPGVPIYCLYGHNKPTELWYEYANGLSEQPTCIHCDEGGDGVVPLQSLLKCLDMNPVASKTFNLVGHMDLVKDPLFFSAVLDVLSGNPIQNLE